jgi:signal transduction histidine kinase
VSEKSFPFRKNRPWVLFLIVLIVSLCIAFAWAAINTARDMRLRYTQERVLGTARLVARLLDKECDAAISVTQVLAKRPGLAEAVRSGNKQAIRPYLSDAVDLVPDLLMAGAYAHNGQVLSSYPSSLPPPKALSAVLFDHRAAVRYISTLALGSNASNKESTEILVLAIPVEKEGKAVGYLQVYYRVGELNRWLRQLRMGKGTLLYVVNPSGQIITTGGDINAHILRMHKIPFALPQHNPPYGVFRSHFTKAIGDTLIGYAHTQISGWTVLIVQSTRTALAATNYVVSVLSLLFLPLLGILVGAGWLINKLYAHQEALVEATAAQNEQLRQADRIKSDFLANVSHDLRTPLASIQICLSGLLDPTIEWNRKQAQESLQLASEGLSLLTAKVRNLLEMARIESHALSERRELCDMTDIVGAALEKLAPLLNGRNIWPHFPPEPLLVECDQSQMETVVSNLVENALKYSPPGTPIRLSGEQSNGKVVITVQDDGPGVSPGLEERIFEKFFRAPSHPTTGGTGLGLAICKAIVEAHGGTISVRNAPCGGAIFWFSLPASSVGGEEDE